MHGIAFPDTIPARKETSGRISQISDEIRTSQRIPAEVTRILFELTRNLVGNFDFLVTSTGIYGSFTFHQKFGEINLTFCPCKLTGYHRITTDLAVNAEREGSSSRIKIERAEHDLINSVERKRNLPCPPVHFYRGNLM